MQWQRDTTGHALFPHFPVLLIGGAFIFLLALPQIMFGDLNMPQQTVNCVLFGAVLVVWTLWLFVYRAGWASVESGGGLGVAVLAIVLRLVGECAVWFVDHARHVGALGAPEAFVATAVTWTRPLGVVGVVFGLAMVATGVAGDRAAVR